MTKRDSEAVAANRRAWNAAAEHHKADRQWAALAEGFARPGFSCLDEVETGLWRELGFEGLSVAQICCNNGRELLSLRNLGAGRCVGFDLSAAFLEQARELNAIAGQDCEFVEADALALPGGFEGAFDRVFTTIGVFGWMPDLGRFFAGVSRLLRPGGAYFAYEEHPIMNMFEPEAEDPERPVNSYFKAEPFAEAVSLDYWGKRDYDAPLHYWFVHPLSAIVTACLDKGLAVERLAEFPHNVNAAVFDRYENRPAQLPLSFALVARKAPRAPGEGS